MAGSGRTRNSPVAIMQAPVTRQMSHGHQLVAEAQDARTEPLCPARHTSLFKLLKESMSSPSIGSLPVLLHSCPPGIRQGIATFREFWKRFSIDSKRDAASSADRWYHICFLLLFKALRELYVALIFFVAWISCCGAKRDIGYRHQISFWFLNLILLMLCYITKINVI
jgi:hypothetical protein